MKTPDDILEVDEVMEENEAPVTYDITSYPSDLTLSVVNEIYVSIPQKLKDRLISLYNDYIFNHTDKEIIIKEMLYFSEQKM